MPSALKNKWLLDPLRNHEDGRDSLNQNTSTPRKIVYVIVNEKTDILKERHKNLWVMHGLNEVLRPYKTVCEKSQV